METDISYEEFYEYINKLLNLRESQIFEEIEKLKINNNTYYIYLTDFIDYTARGYLFHKNHQTKKEYDISDLGHQLNLFSILNSQINYKNTYTQDKKEDYNQYLKEVLNYAKKFGELDNFDKYQVFKHYPFNEKLTPHLAIEQRDISIELEKIIDLEVEEKSIERIKNEITNKKSSENLVLNYIKNKATKITEKILCNDKNEMAFDQIFDQILELTEDNEKLEELISEILNDNTLEKSYIQIHKIVFIWITSILLDKKLSIQKIDKQYYINSDLNQFIDQILDQFKDQDPTLIVQALTTIKNRNFNFFEIFINYLQSLYAYMQEYYKTNPSNSINTINESRQILEEINFKEIINKIYGEDPFQSFQTEVIPQKKLEFPISMHVNGKIPTAMIINEKIIIELFQKGVLFKQLPDLEKYQILLIPTTGKIDSIHYYNLIEYLSIKFKYHDKYNTYNHIEKLLIKLANHQANGMIHNVIDICIDQTTNEILAEIIYQKSTNMIIYNQIIEYLIQKQEEINDSSLFGKNPTNYAKEDLINYNILKKLIIIYIVYEINNNNNKDKKLNKEQ